MTKLFYLIFLSPFLFYSQQKEYKVIKIAFYNVENLYDTITSVDLINGDIEPQNQKFQVSIPEDSLKYLKIPEYKGSFNFSKLKNKQVIRKQSLNDEFTPDGKKNWNSFKYNEKLKNISKVLSEIGNEIDKNPPIIIGLCEVENLKVLEDLVKTPLLKPYNYGIAHLNSMDERGVDTALLYQKKFFEISDFKKIVLELKENDKRDYTRDILKVEGKIENEKFVFLVNHWPSRRGGEEISEPKRILAAQLLASEIKNIPLDYKIIIMGDFNDDPISHSIYKELNATESKNISEYQLFNPFYKLYKNGLGSLAYNDAMNLFDQIIINKNLLEKNGWFYFQANIFSPNYLISTTGLYKGYPFRSYSGDNYTGGYSDHFPVYITLIKEKK